MAYAKVGAVIGSMVRVVTLLSWVFRPCMVVGGCYEDLMCVERRRTERFSFLVNGAVNWFG